MCYRTVFWTLWRGRGWDDLGEWHWNMYNIIYEMSRQSRFNAWYWMLGAGALGWPRGMVWGGRREEGSGWGTHVCLWRIHFDIWQNQYNIVKLKNKIKLKKYIYIHVMSFHIIGGQKTTQGLSRIKKNIMWNTSANCKILSVLLAILKT